MGASLACAVRARRAGAEGYLVALADMPFIRPSTIAAVRDALVGGRRHWPRRISAPGADTRWASPAAFRAQLEALHGDDGARSSCIEHEQASW